MAGEILKSGAVEGGGFRTPALRDRLPYSSSQSYDTADDKTLLHLQTSVMASWLRSTSRIVTFQPSRPAPHPLERDVVPPAGSSASGKVSKYAWPLYLDALSQNTSSAPPAREPTRTRAHPQPRASSARPRGSRTGQPRRRPSRRSRGVLPAATRCPSRVTRTVPVDVLTSATPPPCWEPARTDSRDPSA